MLEVSIVIAVGARSVRLAAIVGQPQPLQE